MKKTILTVTGIMGLMLSGCGSIQSLLPGKGEPYTYQGIAFGNDRSETFKQGVQDGCATAAGTYTKNHDLFRADTDYKIGWEEGRLKCGTKQ